VRADLSPSANVNLPKAYPQSTGRSGLGESFTSEPIRLRTRCGYRTLLGGLANVCRRAVHPEDVADVRDSRL